MFFSNYRFSEDLDFTIINNFNISVFKKELKKSLKILTEYAEILFQPIKVVPLIYNDKIVAYRILIPYWGANHRDQPTNREWQSKIKIELTLNEILVYPPKKNILLHSYSDSLIQNQVISYSIEEIIIEKLRALIQRSYSAPRDYYDLWYIFKSYPNMDFKKIVKPFYIKCKYKKLNFISIEDFFKNDKLNIVKQEWENSLKHHLKNLPDYYQIINELKEILEKKWIKNANF